MLFEIVLKIDKSWLRGASLVSLGIIGTYLSSSDARPSIGFPFSLDVSLIGLSLMGAGFYIGKWFEKQITPIITYCLGGVGTILSFFST